jgi:hypothetical protein
VIKNLLVEARHGGIQLEFQHWGGRWRQDNRNLKASLGYLARPCLKRPRAGKVVEHLPSMYKALSLIPSTTTTTTKSLIYPDVVVHTCNPSIQKA